MAAAIILLLPLELGPAVLWPRLELPGGGGVLQAAVSASDQIFGLLFADDEVGDESCC